MHLNPYCSIIQKKEDSMEFFLRIEDRHSLTKAETDFLLKVLPCEQQFLQTKIKPAKLEALIASNILLSKPLTTNEQTSVNTGWFLAEDRLKDYEQLQTKTILILGCGGLGTHVAWHLAALNVKKLVLIDDDVIERSNLNRQLFYEVAEIGTSKTVSLQKHLHQINPELTVHIYNQKISNPELELTPILQKEAIDLVVKAVDSPFNHVQLFSRYFIKLKMPYVSGATL